MANDDSVYTYTSPKAIDTEYNPLTIEVYDELLPPYIYITVFDDYFELYVNQSQLSPEDAQEYSILVTLEDDQHEEEEPQEFTLNFSIEYG